MVPAKAVGMFFRARRRRSGVDFMKPFWPKFTAKFGQIKVCNYDLKRH
jgi:hypothetical protein